MEKEKNKTQISFENLLEQNGFTVSGTRTYQTRTKYTISKNGTELDWVIHHVSGDNGAVNFKQFSNLFSMKMMLESM